MSKNEKIAYGMRPVLELIESGLNIKKIYLEQGKTQTKFQDITKICLSKNISFDEKSERFIEKLCESENHQGVMAIYTPLERRICFDDRAYSPRTGRFLCVFLDNIQDPQNLGAIVRSCEFFGADQIFYPEHNSASFNQVALKASAGGGIYNPPYKVSSVATLFEKFKAKNFQIIGTDPDKGQEISDIDFCHDTLIVIGSEGEGMSAKTRSYCTSFAKISGPGKVSSLNASVSAGVILHQIKINRVKIFPVSG